MKPTRVHYQSSMRDAVHIAGHRIGTVRTVTTKDAFDGERVMIRGTCYACCCEVDAQGVAVADDDHSGARYHVSADAAAEAVGKHALKCGEMIAEMTRGARAVAA